MAGNRVFRRLSASDQKRFLHPPTPSFARGQGHGFIRVADGRRVFFHRNDSPRGVFNDLAEGDVVSFHLYDDLVSGPRALTVRRQARTHKPA